MRLGMILTLALLGTCPVGPGLIAAEKGASRRAVRPLQGTSTEKVLQKPTASSAVGVLPSLGEKNSVQPTGRRVDATQIVPNGELPQALPRTVQKTSKATVPVPLVSASTAPQMPAALPSALKTSKSEASVRHGTMPAPTAQHLVPLAATTLPVTKSKP
jgi:hypothetical protein